MDARVPTADVGEKIAKSRGEQSTAWNEGEVAPRRLIVPTVLYRLDRCKRFDNPRRRIADRKGGRVVERAVHVRRLLPQRGGAVENVRPDCGPKLACFRASRIQLAGGSLDLCDRLSQRLHVGISDRWILMPSQAPLRAHAGSTRTSDQIAP